MTAGACVSWTAGVANACLSAQIFTIQDALLFEEYLFVGLLELYDWAESEWSLMSVSLAGFVPMLGMREMAWE